METDWRKNFPGGRKLRLTQKVQRDEKPPTLLSKLQLLPDRGRLCRVFQVLLNWQRQELVSRHKEGFPQLASGKVQTSHFTAKVVGRGGAGNDGRSECGPRGVRSLRWWWGTLSCDL